MIGAKSLTEDDVIKETQKSARARTAAIEAESKVDGKFPVDVRG